MTDGEATARLAHDLQEPLRTVAGYLQLIARRYGDRLDPEGRELVRHAVEGVHRMEALVRDLLAYTRVETGRASLVETAMDEAFAAAVANLAASREETDAAITRDPLPCVRGDATQLTALFQNLIANAIRFRGPASPTIHVGATRESDEWRFTVSDNGIGIPPEHRERVFMVFQRLHTPEEYPGTGIGLAICKRIVERHGGRIGVEAATGPGTTVWFTLPVRPGHS